MHDPDVVAFTIRCPWLRPSGLPATGSRDDGVRWRIRRHHTCISLCAEDPPHRQGAFPWWKPGSYMSHWRLAGRDYWWPPMVTVWHREPGGRDALSVCSRRYQDRDGRWHLTRSWRWHAWHYRLQFHGYQVARRWLLTRCEWCGGRSVKGDPVNCSASWHPKQRPWWRGEADLFHAECLSVHQAQHLCLCEFPGALAHGNYGQCSACGRFRPYGYVPNPPDRLLASLGHRERPGKWMRARLDAMHAAKRQAEEAGGL